MGQLPMRWSRTKGAASSLTACQDRASASAYTRAFVPSAASAYSVNPMSGGPTRRVCEGYPFYPFALIHCWVAEITKRVVLYVADHNSSNTGLRTIQSVNCLTSQRSTRDASDWFAHRSLVPGGGYAHVCHSPGQDDWKAAEGANAVRSLCSAPSRAGFAIVSASHRMVVIKAELEAQTARGSRSLPWSVRGAAPHEIVDGHALHRLRHRGRLPVSPCRHPRLAGAGWSVSAPVRHAHRLRRHGSGGAAVGGCDDRMTRRPDRYPRD